MPKATGPHSTGRRCLLASAGNVRDIGEAGEWAWDLVGDLLRLHGAD